MKVKYQERLVAFVDVLGFKDLINSDSATPINNYYSFLLSKFKESTTRKNMEYLLISDSIVIYSDVTKTAFQEMIILIKYLQVGLAFMGITVRGGISFGKLYTNKIDNVIVGEGLINAFQLENIAKYPRVIVDRNLIYRFYKNEKEMILSNISPKGIPHVTLQPFHAMLSDFPFINYGSFIAGKRSVKSFSKVIELIKINFANNSNIEKYQWLKNYLINCSIEAFNAYSSLDSPTRQDRERIKYAKRFELLLCEI